MSELDVPVVFAEKPLNNSEKKIAFIHLNSPATFNSLTLEMVELMQAEVDRWAADEAVVAVFLDGEGEKAFCAGGDVKSLYNGRVDTDNGIENPSAVKFFDLEYHLDLSLHNFPKPIICWGHGVLMGGGIGLFAGCSHRIVTEKTRSAMPEITIGLFPDVGGSYFLNKMPGKIGLFLGLSGASINGADAVYCGLATHFVSQDKKTELMQALEVQNDFSEIALNALIKSFEDASQELRPKSALEENMSFINNNLAGDSLVDIADVFVNACSQSEIEWLQQAGKTFAAGCPITAHLVFEQLKRGAQLSLSDVFEMERKISARCMAQADFYEGVRALLIDKDKNPTWTHKNVSEVKPELIEEFF